ncbi:protein split ends-like [Macrobrachium rosenbergii]|uniref:protein split ends-like n=1 Tax=Macrobrachium rosenbergii TaxID=79674 RepID=UPI0034D71E9F
MMVADLQSKNPPLKSLLNLNEAKAAQGGQGSDSCSVPLSASLEANSSQPSTSFQVSRPLRQSEQVPPNASASGLQSQNDQVGRQQQSPVMDFEEIELFLHTIQHQLQSSQNEKNSAQAAVHYRRSQQPSHRSCEHIKEDAEVMCLTEVRAVQSHKRTQSQQSLPRDEANKACQTVQQQQQQNLSRTPLPKQTNTTTHNLQTLQYLAQQSSHCPQNQGQAHTNPAQSHQFPQHSRPQHDIQRSQNLEQILKNTTPSFQAPPQHSPQRLCAQRPQNPQENHLSRHPQPPHFQRLQQVHNSAGHNVHPPLGSPQPLDQRIHNAYQVQNPAQHNNNVQSPQQHLHRTTLPPPPYSGHRFPPPQDSPQPHFQRPLNPQNLKPSHHSQYDRSMKEHPNSQHTQQKPQVLSPLPLQTQQSPGQAYQDAVRRQLLLKKLQRPLESPVYSHQRPNYVNQAPLFRAPLLPKQRYQQPNIFAKSTQGAPSSIQQLPSAQGREQVHIGNLNQCNASQRSPNGSNSKNMHQSGGQDQRICGLNSTVNCIGSKNTYFQSDSQDSPQQNGEPQATQPQVSPINFQVNWQNLPAIAVEINKTNILSRNQQNSDSLPETSSEFTHSCSQNKGVCDDTKVQLQPSTQNAVDDGGPFLKIVKEEPLSDMSENCMTTNWQCNNTGKEISIKDSLDVSEFFHLEDISVSEVVSGSEKRDSCREPSLERNVDILPQAIITPPQTPPTPIASTLGRSTSPALSITTPQVMKKLATQDYTLVHQAMVDCSAEENNDNSIAIPNTVSHVTEAPSNSLRALNDTVPQRKKSRGPGDFLNSSATEDTSIGNSEIQGNKSTAGEKCSLESPVKFSSKNKERGPEEITGLKQSSDLHADLATDLCSTSRGDASRLTKSPDNPIQLVSNNNVPKTNKRQDQELTFRCSEETDKAHEQSRVLLNNSQEEQSCVMPGDSQEKMTSLEQVGTSSKSSAVERLVVCSTNSSTVYKSDEYISQDEKNSENPYKSDEYISQDEKNIENPLQHDRHSEGKRSSRDNGEISRTEYVVESAKSEPVIKSLNCSPLESSLSELHGIVEYVHVTDLPEGLETGSPGKIKGAHDGLEAFEVSPHASDVKEEKWNIEESNVNTSDSESSDYAYKIFLSRDEVTGRVANPEVIPECCPMCYTAICPSRFTVNTNTFDMTTVCIGCELTILMSWTSEADAGINKKRPCPKSRRHSVPKRLKCQAEQ